MIQEKIPALLGADTGGICERQDRHFTVNQQKNAGCRSRCGIIRTKAKAPVIETTLSTAVQVPTEESGILLCPEFCNAAPGRINGCGLGAMVRKAIDVAVLTVSTPSPPDAYETVSSGFLVRTGTETMKPITTPSTQGNTTHDHHQAALVLRAQNHLALALFELRNSTGDTPTRKAMGLAYAAARSLSQVVGGAV